MMHRLGMGPGSCIWFVGEEVRGSQDQVPWSTWIVRLVRLEARARIRTQKEEETGRLRRVPGPADPGWEATSAHPTVS